MEKATQEMASIHYTPLLATKLHMPRPSARLVHRSLLDERLAQGMTGALTLISAPAGFGKTTLLSDYLTRIATPVAWLSLEREDNDLARFLFNLPHSSRPGELASTWHSGMSMQQLVGRKMQG